MHPELINIICIYINNNPLINKELKQKTYFLNDSLDYCLFDNTKSHFNIRYIRTDTNMWIIVNPLMENIMRLTNGMTTLRYSV